MKLTSRLKLRLFPHLSKGSFQRIAEHYGIARFENSKGTETGVVEVGISQINLDGVFDS